jgi:pyridoxal phosphate enzyme (YggS family)
MDNETDRELSRRLDQVKQRIEQSAAKVGRDVSEITLVAVTKTWPVEIVVSAYRAGIRDIGENRAGELSTKKEHFLERIPESVDLTWHQIGTLQSRKTSLVAEHADVFHALDRLKIARRLSRTLVELDRSLPVFVEVNLSGESSKSGFSMNNWEEDATQRDMLRKVIREVIQLPGLELQGLMTMAPWDVEDEIIRSVFRRTRQLAEWLREEVPGADLPHLSMGMTDDFEIAIEEGATYVRIGRAIFGSRT